jgi:hypothetical protein
MGFLVEEEEFDEVQFVNDLIHDLKKEIVD